MFCLQDELLSHSAVVGHELRTRPVFSPPSPECIPTFGSLT